LKKVLPGVLRALLALSLFGAALFVLQRNLAELRYHHLTEEIANVPAARLLLAGFFTILSYLTLTGYDVLGLRLLGRKIPYRRTAMASFVGFAISNNTGFALLVSVPVRYLLYASWGLSAFDVGKVVAFNGLTLWTGFLTAAGAVFLLEPLVLPGSIHIPQAALHPIGLVCLGMVATYLYLTTKFESPFRFKRWEIPMPRPSISFAQVAVSTADWMLAAAVLYSLLPPTPSLSYPKFLGIFLLAQVAGIVSQIPGGLGVFESIVASLLSPYVAVGPAFAALLVFRAIYYLVPLGAAIVLMAGREMLRMGRGEGRFAGAFETWGRVIVPQALAIGTFAAGIVLLHSGALPAVGSRLHWMSRLMPLSVTEVSHFLGSLAGLMLLLLARGLQRRLDAAYVMVVGSLGAGIVFALLRGFDYEEASILAVVLLCLLPFRRQFYRRSSLLAEPFTPGWVSATGMALIGFIGLGLFAFRNVAYRDDLWWTFTLRGDAPRFLRASVGVVALAACVGLAKLLRPAPPEPGTPHDEELSRAREIVARAPRTSANLALLGDKRFLFSASGRSFLMYAVKGRSWVTMGDPVGEPEEISELLWAFRELCDRHDGRMAFYEVHRDRLHAYAEMGLTMLKLGEEAHVPLEAFSLEGRARKELRHVIRQAERDGCRFEIVPASGVPALMPALQEISDAWLADKKAREKGFSLGRFDPGYLANFPMALVRSNGRIEAFGNVWAGAGQEYSVDLMRSRPDAPRATMDYMFTHLMLRGHEEGYRWFNLGMAPFSGLESGPLVPLWSRLGNLLFQHGEHFYNFQGIRQYKEKFLPEWEPIFLVVQPGLDLPRVLANITALISSGLSGAVRK